MAKSQSTSKPAVKETPKEGEKFTPQNPYLFFLQIPAEHPQMSPEPTLHYGLATGHLKEQIENLETVEQLAVIDQENNTIHAMSYGIIAVIEKLKDVYEHFKEMNNLIKPWPDAKKGGAQ